MISAAAPSLVDPSNTMRPIAPRRHSSDWIHRPQPVKKRLEPRDAAARPRAHSRGVVTIADELVIMDNEQPPSPIQTANGVTRSASPLSVPLPPPRIEVNHEDDRIEPVVQDFADKYIPKEFQPERPARQKRESSTMAHISTLQLSSDEEGAPPPPDLSRRGIHIPSRTSSATVPTKSRRYASGSSVHTTPETRDKSSYAESISSNGTSASSLPKGELPALQARALDEVDRLSPLAEDDPSSFDLVPQAFDDGKTFSLEKRSEQMFSRRHLEEIFADPVLMLRFTTFLSTSRPQSIPLLIYYLDSLKALRAINYANAVAEALEPIQGHDFTEHPARPTVNSVLEDKASQAFDALVRDELPAYIGHVFIQYVSISVQRRICGTLPPHLREASEGLAEVFCLTDPSRPDNPIIFASEEFHRTTRYGVDHAIGRNCRFLQGPRTNPDSHLRIRKAIDEEREHSEVFLNYRRDGSPFMNLLMIAPLFDSRGKLRYFIGAQVDVSGLVKENTDLEAMQRVVEKEAANAAGEAPEDQEEKDEFQELSEMLNTTELDIVRRHGGKMHRNLMDEGIEDDDNEGMRRHRPRLLLNDSSPDATTAKLGPILVKTGGRLEGIYQHYLLVRPYPSLRILFASPALRVPGMLQSPFLSRIGGSQRVRDELTAALAAGRGVTAKVRWIPATIASRYAATDSNSGSYGSDEGRPRWIHCTPLLGHNGAVGVWMVVIIDEDAADPARRRLRMAPPVAQSIVSSGVKAKAGARSINSDGDAEGRQPPSTDGATDRGRHASAGMPSGAPNNHAGGYAEWERRRAGGLDVDGEGSLNSFTLM